MSAGLGFLGGSGETPSSRQKAGVLISPVLRLRRWGSGAFDRGREGDNASGREAAITSGRRRLVASLLLSAVIPLLLFGCWVAYLTAERDRLAARRDAFDTATRVAERVSSELQKELEIAEALAASPSLDGSAVDQFYVQAQRITDARPLWESVVLLDPYGNQVLNVPRPLNAPADPSEDRRAFEKVLRLQSPVIGEVGQVGVGGKKLVLLRVPVVRSRELKYVITVGLVPSEIRKILNHAGAPKGWSGLIVDGKGNVVARTAEKFSAGAPASAAVRNAVARLPEGFYSDRSADGVKMEAVYRSLPGTSQWSVHFLIPAEALNAGVSRSLLLMVAGAAASLALAAALALIIARDLAQRRRGEEVRAALALQISEERGALALKAADLGAWRWELDNHKIVASERALRLLDLKPSRVHGNDAEWGEHQFLSAVDERDRAKLADAVKACMEARHTMDLEFRLLRPNGNVHWFRATGRALNDDTHHGATVYGVLSDIQSSKQAHAQHVHLLRRLADARESEQRRIARELHDQIGQTVTGLALGLKSLEQSLSAKGRKRETLKQLRWVQMLAGDVGRDLHRVAADLRPVALDDLGLFNAVSAHAAEWSRISGIKVDIQSVGNDQKVPQDVSIAVYRCVQEALNNIVKHAAARHVSIVLELKSDELRVVVEDDGSGFDSAVVGEADLGAASPRLGISGIRERLGIVGGGLTIESMKDAGSALFFQVPIQKCESRT